MEEEQSSLLNEEDCLALLFWVLLFLFAFFYLSANMTPYPFLFYTALVFPIPLLSRQQEDAVPFLIC